MQSFPGAGAWDLGLRTQAKERREREVRHPSCPGEEERESERETTNTGEAMGPRGLSNAIHDQERWRERASEWVEHLRM